MKTSFVIPLYRKEYLHQQLEYITTQAGFNNNQEVIFVENPAKTDEAAEIISRFSDYNIKHLESAPGANRARNVGIDAAENEIIILLDDDCFPEQNLLQAYLGAYSLYPGVTVFGGKVLHTYRARRPKWFYGYFQHAVGYLDRGEEVYDVSACNTELDGGLISANLTFRKAAWNAVGGFKEYIGQQDGHKPELSNADEILFINDLGKLAKNEPFAKMYVGRAVAWHQIDADRMTIEYLIKKSAGHGRGSAESILESKRTKDLFLEDAVAEFLMVHYHSTLNHHDLMCARQQIAHEESMRIFIKNVLLCRAAFIQAFIETLQKAGMKSYEDPQYRNDLFLENERYGQTTI